MATFRIGMGYDVHKLVAGRPLILGGMEIPFEKGLLGHSDADVLLHALCDAMLGAAGLGDIGRHFPDTDPTFKGISSLTLLETVNQNIKKKGFILSNADITLIAQKPKIAPYIPEMESKVATICEVDESIINIKATTTEGLGITGSGEAMAAYAVALLSTILP